MSHQSLKERLATFLRKYHSEQWISSGELQRIVAEQTTYTPQNVGRRLRELENEGVVDVKYISNHAYYRFAKDDFESRRLRGLREFDALPA